MARAPGSVARHDWNRTLRLSSRYERWSARAFTLPRTAINMYGLPHDFDATALVGWTLDVT
jgi:hypothetical protein